MDVPRMYRTMVVDEDRLPAVANTYGLGVRTPADAKGRKWDVEPDQDGIVRPGEGGMSVLGEIDWRRMPLSLIPRSTGLRRAGAKRGAEFWVMGDGSFETAAVAEGLALRAGLPSKEMVAHGLVEPAREMSVDDLRARLAATRSSWRRVQIEARE